MVTLRVKAWLQPARGTDDRPCIIMPLPPRFQIVVPLELLGISVQFSKSCAADRPWLNDHDSIADNSRQIRSKFADFLSQSFKG
jgi:hypothetical protein